MCTGTYQKRSKNIAVIQIGISALVLLIVSGKRDSVLYSDRLRLTMWGKHGHGTPLLVGTIVAVVIIMMAANSLYFGAIRVTEGCIIKCRIWTWMTWVNIVVGIFAMMEILFVRNMKVESLIGPGLWVGINCYCLAIVNAYVRELKKSRHERAVQQPTSGRSVSNV